MQAEKDNHNGTTKQLDGIYRFIAETYQGNWQFRFQSTPYMQDAVKAGKQESIHGHVWACMEFWYLLKQICPKLTLLINSEKLYEILLNHDLGEVYNGDSPAFQQIQNTDQRKGTERESLIELISFLPSHERDLIL